MNHLRSALHLTTDCLAKGACMARLSLLSLFSLPYIFQGEEGHVPEETNRRAWLVLCIDPHCLYFHKREKTQSRKSGNGNFYKVDLVICFKSIMDKQQLCCLCSFQCSSRKTISAVQAKVNFAIQSLRA